MSQPNIHPTAIIADTVTIGSGTTVGPYVCIDGDVTIGSDCTIQSHAVITGTVTIGDHNLIGYGAIVGADPQDLSYTDSLNSSVVIGNNNTIREHATIHRAATQDGITRLGNSCFLMGAAHVAHDCQLGDHVIMANNCMLGGHVHIGDRVFLGGGAGVHQFVRIGRLTIIEGNAGISKNVPPFLLVAGHNNVCGMNVVGLRRAGLTVGERRDIKAAYHLTFLEGLNISQVLDAAGPRNWGTHATEFFDFIRSTSKRGIAPLRATK